MDKKERNERFLVAVDYLFKENLVRNQTDLCQKVGIGVASYSRIKTGVRIVSDDTIRKLNDAFGGIFNMAYFRGDSETLLANIQEPAQELPAPVVDTGSILNALIAAKDETIDVMAKQLKDKESIIQAKDDLIKTLQVQLDKLQKELKNQRLGDYRFNIASEPNL
jgi:transcriptional regulator with XRE-family HTH domain